MLLALALAHAGDLTVTVVVDDQSSSFVFDQVASCSEASSTVSGDGTWEVSARATGIEEGEVFVALDVEVETGKRRNARHVRMAPRLVLVEGEPAQVVVGGPDGEVSVEVIAQDFEIDDSCTGGHKRSRTRTITRERG